MILEEFSNTLDTLLNSYGSQSQFGEEASKREVVLNEYEKSVILTQAQDIIVKSYFDATLNSQGQGFDDSARRQVDFSSLIKVANLKKAPPLHITVSWEQGSYKIGEISLTRKTSQEITVVLKVTSESLEEEPVEGFKVEYADNIITITLSPVTISDQYDNKISGIFNMVNGLNVSDTLKIKELVEFQGLSGTIDNVSGDYTILTHTFEENIYNTFDDRGIVFELPKKKDPKGEDIPETTEVLFLLNEKLKVNGQTYVIVPISYREYDREMSKAYAQPLKKQAWRLFQNISTGFDVNSELIPRWDISTASDFEYKIRYVRRPQPIILEKLPDGLTVDGLPGPSDCELNPILHMDIINKAVEIALNTRIGAAPQQQPQSK